MVGKKHFHITIARSEVKLPSPVKMLGLVAFIILSSKSI